LDNANPILDAELYRTARHRHLGRYFRGDAGPLGDRRRIACVVLGYGAAAKAASAAVRQEERKAASSTGIGAIHAAGQNSPRPMET
jgi:hypothetical protein